jgi:TPR repeat protein
VWIGYTGRMIHPDKSRNTAPHVWPRMGLAVLLVLGLSACEGEGENFQAQVAAAEAANDFPTVIALWGTRADGGDTKAILEIAALYETGPEAIQDFSLAAESYAQAVNLGNATAMARLGGLYERGQGVDRDLEQARLLYAQAVELGDPEGFYRSGRLLFNTNSARRSIVYAKAIEQYEMAAEMGLVDAQLELANHFFSGFRVPKDSERAVKWYQVAAEHGHPGAQFRLGFMLSLGIGVAKDEIAAYAWVRLAAAQGLITAIETLADLGAGLDPDGLATAQALSLEYWDLYVAPFQGGD